MFEKLYASYRSLHVISLKSIMFVRWHMRSCESYVDSISCVVFVELTVM